MACEEWSEGDIDLTRVDYCSCCGHISSRQLNIPSRLDQLRATRNTVLREFVFYSPLGDKRILQYVSSEWLLNELRRECTDAHEDRSQGQIPAEEPFGDCSQHPKWLVQSQELRRIRSGSKLFCGKLARQNVCLNILGPWVIWYGSWSNTKTETNVPGMNLTF